MIKEIEIGELYAVKLIEKYWPNTEFLVQINGITRKQSTELFSSMSVKAELFDKFNLGLNSFLSNYNDEIDVYLCNIISSLQPLTIEETEFLLLPKSCIDFDYSEKFLETHNLNYLISGVNRYFPPTESLNDFIKLSKEQLKENLNYYSSFTSTTSLIEVSTESIYKRESEINIMNNENDSIFETYELAKTQNQSRTEELRRYYEETSEKYNIAMKEMELEKVKLQTLQNESSTLQLLNIDLNQDLIKIKTMMRDLVNNTIVPAGKDVGIHVDDFDTMFENIQNAIDKE